MSANVTTNSQGSIDNRFRFFASLFVALFGVIIVSYQTGSALWALWAVACLLVGWMQGETLRRTFVAQIPFLIVCAVLKPNVGWTILVVYLLVTTFASRAGFMHLLALGFSEVATYALASKFLLLVPAEAWIAAGLAYLMVRTTLAMLVARITGLPLDVGTISGGWALLGATVFTTVTLLIFYFNRVEMSEFLNLQFFICSLAWLVVLASYQRSTEVFRAGLIGLGNLLSYAHAYTAGHSRRVGYLARETGRRLGIPEWKLDHVVDAALLHDIGKLAVDERILEKPGRLTDEEFAVIKTHPVVGEKIVGSIDELRNLATWIRHHHEKIDGTGYPDKIQERTIPIESRLIAVIDAYDAMTGTSADGHRRLYRDPVSSDSALEELKRCAGTQFDKRVVAAFSRVVKASQKGEESV
jgi:putative nucleotidyltransferase with HDIG domain